MILKRISILNYKNLEEVELGFSAKLNCFFGLNGMGKTNLLDAVYFLSFCKSSGNPIDSQNIRHEQDFFVIQGFYEAEDGTPEEIYCGMKRRSKKQFFLHRELTLQQCVTLRQCFIIPYQCFKIFFIILRNHYIHKPATFITPSGYQFRIGR